MGSLGSRISGKQPCIGPMNHEIRVTALLRVQVNTAKIAPEQRAGGVESRVFILESLHVSPFVPTTCDAKSHVRSSTHPDLAKELHRSKQIF